MQSTLLLALSLIATVSAVPDVTVVPLDTDCSAYPAYNNESGQAGPWIVVADSTNSSIEGHGDTQTFSRGSDGIRWGYITIPADNRLAKTALQCSNETLQGYVETGVGGYSWQPLVAATSIPYSAEFGYGFGNDNSPVVPYAHYINGTQQPGVFLGAENVTTWAFQYNNDTEFGEYYSIRLLGPDSADPSTGDALFPGEFTGFIKVPGQGSMKAVCILTEDDDTLKDRGFGCGFFVRGS